MYFNVGRVSPILEKKTEKTYRKSILNEYKKLDNQKFVGQKMKMPSDFKPPLRSSLMIIGT